MLINIPCSLGCQHTTFGPPYRCPAASFEPRPSSQITVNTMNESYVGEVVRISSCGRNNPHKTRINKSVRRPAHHTAFLTDTLKLQNVKSLPAFVHFHRHNSETQPSPDSEPRRERSRQRENDRDLPAETFLEVSQLFTSLFPRLCSTVRKLLPPHLSFFLLSVKL